MLKFGPNKYKNQLQSFSGISLLVLKVVRTIPGEDNRNVLLTEGADGQQHGRLLGSDEAEGHVFSGPAVCGNAGGM